MHKKVIHFWIRYCVTQNIRYSAIPFEPAYLLSQVYVTILAKDKHKPKIQQNEKKKETKLRKKIAS